MASYKVILKPSVEKDLRSLPKSAIGWVINRLERLRVDPFPRQAIKLEGGEQLYRISVGDYRVAYSVNQKAKEIVVHYIRHRREVYRTLWVDAMLIVMKADATDGQVEAVVRVIENLGYKAHPMPGASRTAIGITGNQSAVDASHFENLPGVAEAVRVSKPYKLVTLDLRAEKTVVRVGDAAIGGEELAIIAGPCAVESRNQAFAVAEVVRRSGAKFFRGGAFKPRTSPYAFQGLGEDGLKILAEIRDAFGLKIVTEALDESGVDLVERYADVIQIGARSMQNFTLLRRVGKSPLPVLLKRGLSATLDEWLLAAEYVMAEGNYRVVLCERGIRTFAQHTRNTLDLAAIPAVRRVSHLPVIVDPSHGTGKNYMVTALARAGVAVGADGLIVEVHDQPDRALSDGAQALTLEQYEQLVSEVRAIHEVIAPAAVT